MYAHTCALRFPIYVLLLHLYFTSVVFKDVMSTVCHFNTWSSDLHFQFLWAFCDLASGKCKACWPWPFSWKEWVRCRQTQVVQLLISKRSYFSVYRNVASDGRCHLRRDNVRAGSGRDCQWAELVVTKCSFLQSGQDWGVNSYTVIKYCCRLKTYSKYNENALCPLGPRSLTTPRSLAMSSRIPPALKMIVETSTTLVDCKFAYALRSTYWWLRQGVIVTLQLLLFLICRVIRNRLRRRDQLPATHTVWTSPMLCFYLFQRHPWKSQRVLSLAT